MPPEPTPRLRYAPKGDMAMAKGFQVWALYEASVVNKNDEVGWLVGRKDTPVPGGIGRARNSLGLMVWGKRENL